MVFTKSGGSNVIDSVSVREGKFIVTPGVTDIEITMVYSNRDSGVTFGSCPVKYLRLSEKTKQSFQEFLRNAELDFGNLVLEGGFITEMTEGSSLGAAESSQGIRPKGLGG